MSSPTHPDDATLAQYAAGSMRPGFDLVVAAHLDSCPQCRAQVRRFEAAAGALFCEAPQESLPDEALDRMLARLDREPRSFAPDHAPRDTRRLIDKLKVRPKRWLGPGSWVQPIETPVLKGDKLYFLRVAAGLHGIPHSHQGAEFTNVIYGALNDRGTIYPAGSFIAETPQTSHQPHVMPDDGGCLCLVATEGGLTTTDWISGLIKAWAGV